MSSVVIGLLFLSLGWKLYKDAIYTRYLALRNTGHPQYFGGALCAAYLAALSFALDRSLTTIGFYASSMGELIGVLPILPDKANGAPPPVLIRMLIWAFPISWALTRLLNWPLHRSPSLLMAVARKTRIVDELEDVIYYCLRANPKLCLAITTKSKKVYIGVPKRHSPDPDRDRAWLSLRPLVSGYRDDKGGLTLDTFYEEVHGEGKTSSVASYQVVIPASEIQVAQAFDLYAYANYVESKLEAASDIELGIDALRSMTGSAARSMAPASSALPTKTRRNAVRTPTSDHYGSLFRIVAEIVSPRDRYLLRAYSYFVLTMSLGVLLTPVDPKALMYFGLAFVTATDAIKPHYIRGEDALRRLQAKRLARLRRRERFTSLPNATDCH